MDARTNAPADSLGPQHLRYGLVVRRSAAPVSHVYFFFIQSPTLTSMTDCPSVEYCRIDDGTTHEDRIAAIVEYNRPGSDQFIFLLTSRTGWLGINLTMPDVVVLYDSD